MEESTVVLVRCNGYEERAVLGAVERGLNLLGGPGRFVSAGERVLLKPNVLSGNPERCVSTHPAVFRAAATLFSAVSSSLYYGDSPGVGKVAKHMKKAGLTGIAEELGIELADFETGRDVSFPESPLMKRFNVAEGVLEADALISLPKLKTHQITRITGAVKNQFGCLPGLQKARYHLKIQDIKEFSKMLVAICLLVKPRLYIMDGIRAMEGKGPGGGKPVDMMVLLFSTDPVALDATVCRLIGLEPEFVPTNLTGTECGLGNFYREHIKLIGDPIEDFVYPGFDVVRRPFRSVTKSRTIPLFRKHLTRRPVIIAGNCKRCGDCVEICPNEPKAVFWKDGSKKEPPEYDYDRCIRCFCCHEVCPHNAVDIKTPPAARLLFGKK